ncbi:MAG: tRNA (guanosine(46)-N7)-methyltransferase TrmB, partial [Planctomycetota bacterium]
MRLKRTLDTGTIATDFDTLAKPVDFAELFGRTAPVELEIGSGKGTFLVQEAAVRPDTDFFGVEHMKKYAAYAADRCRRAGLTNVRTLGGDAVRFVLEHVPDASLRAVHIYHPDPWPKSRHHKRRIVREDMLRQYERVLEPGGELRIVTDHDGYAEWIAEVLKASVLTPIEYVPPTSAGEGELVGTNFERKYRKRNDRRFHPFAL